MKFLVLAAAMLVTTGAVAQPYYDNNGYGGGGPGPGPRGPYAQPVVEPVVTTPGGRPILETNNNRLPQSIDVPVVLNERYERVVSSLILKGGGSDYTGGIGRYTVIGATYGLAFSVEPLRWLGVEIGYDGSENQSDTLRNPGVGRSTFYRNGASALLKFSAPLGNIRPFAGVGFGLGWVNISGSNNNGAFTNNFMGQVPVTVGIEVISRNWVAGVRATYWVLLNEGFIHAGSSTALGGLMDVQSTLGVRF